MSWRIDQILYQKKKSFWTRVILFPLYLLSLPYALAVRARVLCYAFGLLSSKCLPCPVISIGNITLGGTGKTPLVITLAKGLMERGIQVAVLSRGYRGRKRSGPLVSDGQVLFQSPEESGDEPFLMAKTLQDIPIFVGKDRFLNGRMALEKFHVRGLLLDDGYQYLRLHRDLDVLLIDSSVGFGDGHLLPRGILREPLAHLSRAHLLLLNKIEDPEIEPALKATILKHRPLTRLFHSHYEPLGLIGPGEEWEELHSVKGKKVFAFAGVANPHYFFSLLKGCGIEIVKEKIFPEHHLYTTKDLTSITEEVKNFDRIVTTEKDMVKLQKFNIGLLPIRALRIGVKIWEEEEFYQRLSEVFQKRIGM